MSNVTETELVGSLVFYVMSSEGYSLTNMYTQTELVG